MGASDGRITAALAAVLVAGCATLTRTEGDGGWSAAERAQALSTRAQAARVSLAPAAEPPASVPPAPAALTLARALDLVATGNRRVADAAERLADASAAVREARAGLLPHTTADARYTWYTDPLTVQAPFAQPAGGTPPRFEIREDEVGTVAGRVALPLDVTGALAETLRAAQAGYRGERARAWATTLGAQIAVTRAYFGLLEAERLREVVAERLRVQRAQLEVAQARFDAGRLTKNELLVVEVALRNAEQQGLRQDLAVDRARWALNDALGLPIDAATAVADVPAAPGLPDLADTLAEAYRTNPLVVGLLEEQQRLEHTASALVRRRLPRVEAGGGVDYDTQDVFEPKTVGSGFVGLAWDLGTDGEREAAIARARIALDRNRLAVEQQLRDLERAVRAAHRRVAERLAALAAARASVGQAEENLRIRQQQFGVGRATSDDVLDAESLLTRERAAAATALYQAHARRAELQELSGRDLRTLYPDTR